MLITEQINAGNVYIKDRSLLIMARYSVFQNRRKTNMMKYCEVCHEKLILSDDFLSCPVYLSGKTKDADEHTSFSVSDQEQTLQE